MEPSRTRHARALFAAIAPRYERMGRLLSLGQEPRWRRELVARVGARPGALVLDAASGTGLVARELAARSGVSVVQLEPSEPMLRAGRDGGRLAAMPAVLGRAEELPFADGAFDAVVFTYLLRYVDDPAATLREVTRVLKRGGRIACLEFHVPLHPIARLGWRVYTRLVMPLLGVFGSTAWVRTARFLGPSIEGFYGRYPLPVQIRWWHDAGVGNVRSRTFLFGSAVVIGGDKGGG